MERWNAVVATKYGRRDIFSGGLQYLGLPFNSFSVDIFSAPKNPYRATSPAAQSFGRALHCIPLRPKQHEKVTIFKSYNLHGLFALRHDFYKSYNLSREDINFIHPAMSARLRSTVQRSDSVNRARSNQQKHQLKKSSKEVQDIAILRKKVPAAILG